MVIEKLRGLPDTFHVINDHVVQFSWSIYCRRRNEHIRSAQIDHVVVGPTGVFVLETKNWRRETFDENAGRPHDQADRCGFALWVELANHVRGEKPPVASVVVTTRPMPVTKHGYVAQVSAAAVCNHILTRKTKLGTGDVEDIVDILLRG